MVGLRGAAPRPEDRHERGRHRLGRDAARPAREHRRPLGLRPLLRAGDLRPAEVLHRNFWFCTIDDPSTLVDARRPSASTTSCSRPTTRTATAPGPTRQQVFADVFGGLPADEVAKISHENAAAPVPPPAPAARHPARRRPPLTPCARFGATVARSGVQLTPRKQPRDAGQRVAGDRRRRRRSSGSGTGARIQAAAAESNGASRRRHAAVERDLDVRGPDAEQRRRRSASRRAGGSRGEISSAGARELGDAARLHPERASSPAATAARSAS